MAAGIQIANHRNKPMKHIISTLVVAAASVATIMAWPSTPPDDDGKALEPFILVTSHRWGAIPDDGLDDTDEIQVAIDEAVKGPRRKVVIPEGWFNINAPLRVRSHPGASIEITGKAWEDGDVDPIFFTIDVLKRCPDWVDYGDRKGRQPLKDLTDHAMPRDASEYNRRCPKTTTGSVN